MMESLLQMIRRLLGIILANNGYVDSEVVEDLSDAIRTARRNKDCEALSAAAELMLNFEVPDIPFEKVCLGRLLQIRGDIEAVLKELDNERQLTEIEPDDGTAYAK